MIKFMDIGNCHKSKGGTFEITSDKGGRLETLYWSGPYSKLFVPNCSDFLLIDRITIIVTVYKQCRSQ